MGIKANKCYLAFICMINNRLFRIHDKVMHGINYKKRVCYYKVDYGYSLWE